MSPAPRRQPDAVVEPVVSRIRLRYAKRGRMRFASHRDFARALERALRSAGVPVAHSAGFTPHPKVSYASAAPTGSASEAEYVEIGLTRAVDLAALRRALDAALPAGLDVLDAVVATGGNLPERIQAAHWQVELPGVTVDELAAALHRLRAAGTLTVTRRTKTGQREIDVCAAIVSASAASADSGEPQDLPAPAGASRPARAAPCAILSMVVRITTPAVRPDDVLAALASLDLRPVSPPRAVRLAQGILEADGRLADPLAPDRAAAAELARRNPAQPAVTGSAPPSRSTTAG